MMSEHEMKEGETSTPSSMPNPVALGAATFMSIGVVDLLAHLGPTGLVIGGLAAIVAARHGSDFVEQVRGVFPSSALSETRTERLIDNATARVTVSSHRSFKDRFLGRFPEPLVQEQNTQPDTDGSENDTVDNDDEGVVRCVEDEENTPLDTPRLPTFPAASMYDPAIHREHLVFGPTLFPHANQVYSGRKALFGVSDAGKSNNIAVLAEEYARFGAPVILFDTEGEYESLCETRYFPHPRHVDSMTLSAHQAFDFARQVMNDTLQVVINLQSYDDEQAAWVMVEMIKGVQAWEEAQSSDDRVPCEIILDEATVWLPQNANESTLSKIMVSDPDGSEGEQVSLLYVLQRAFFSVLVRRGRKRGMGFTLAAQRIAEIDKRALSCSWTFLMRQTQVADFKVYKQFGIEAEQALGLLPGEAFVFAPGKKMEQHRFRVRHSSHGATTPGLAGLQKHLQRGRQEQRRPLPEKYYQPGERSIPLVHQQAVPTMQPITQIRPYAVPVPTTTTGHFTSNLTPAMDLALRLYQDGMSYRDLAAKMSEAGIKTGKDSAGQLIRSLKAKKLIA